MTKQGKKNVTFAHNIWNILLNFPLRNIFSRLAAKQQDKSQLTRPPICYLPIYLIPTLYFLSQEKQQEEEKRWGVCSRLSRSKTLEISEAALFMLSFHCSTVSFGIIVSVFLFLY